MRISKNAKIIIEMVEKMKQELWYVPCQNKHLIMRKDGSVYLQCKTQKELIEKLKLVI